MSKQQVTCPIANECAMEINRAIEFIDLDLDESFKNRLPERMDIEGFTINVEKIQHIWERLEAEEQRDFLSRFGDIIGLTNIKVDWDMIKGLMHFWDPEFGCFTFKKMDLMPTAEEYAILMKLPAENSAHNSYIIREGAGLKRQFGKIVNLQAGKIWDIGEMLVQELQGGVVKRQGVPLSTLLSYVARLSCEPGDRQYKLNALALAIYGVVLFPCYCDFIEENVVYLFSQVLLQKVNPCYAILAETFVSLNHCYRSGGGKLSCCVPLLHVWATSHFVIESAKSFSKNWKLDAQLFREASMVRHPNYSASEWVEYFLELNPDTVIWKPKWMKPMNVLYACGTYDWVPLMGPWSGISYAPSLVFRQFGIKQHVPWLKPLNGWEITQDNRDMRERMIQLERAWRDPKITKEIIGEILVVAGYEYWHDTRIRPFSYPGKEVPLLNTSILASPWEPSQEEELNEMWSKQKNIFNDLAAKFAETVHREQALLKNKARMSLIFQEESEKTEMIELKRDNLAKRIEDLEMACSEQPWHAQSNKDGMEATLAMRFMP